MAAAPRTLDLAIPNVPNELQAVVPAHGDRRLVRKRNEEDARYGHAGYSSAGCS